MAERAEAHWFSQISVQYSAFTQGQGIGFQLWILFVNDQRKQS
jgi:hypothetical protein